MTNFGLITWDTCKSNLEMDDRDKELTELLIFSASAEIEIYTDRNLFEREIRELQDGYLQKEIELRQYPVKEILKLYCDTERTYLETKLVDPEYYSCNIPAIEGNAETSSEIILTEGYSFPKGRNAGKPKASNPGTGGLEPKKNEKRTTGSRGTSRSEQRPNTNPL